MIALLALDAATTAVVVSLCTVVLSAVGLVATLVMQSRHLVKTADAQHVSNLESEIALLDRRIEECEEDRKKLRLELEAEVRKREELRRALEKEIIARQAVEERERELARRLEAVERRPS